MTDIEKKAIDLPPETQHKDRITGHIHIHYEQLGEQPESISCVMEKILSTQEGQPYGPRRIKVSRQWKHIDWGWVENPGLLVIENRTGRNTFVNLSEEEKTAIDQRYVLFGNPNQIESCREIWPGYFHLEMPHKIDSLQIYCPNGEANITYMLFPR